MAAGRDYLDPKYLARALEERLVADIKADLKARIMPLVEAEVDAAVDGVVSALGPSLKATFFDHPHLMARELAIEVTTRHVKATESDEASSNKPARLAAVR